MVVETEEVRVAGVTSGLGGESVALYQVYPRKTLVIRDVYRCSGNMNPWWSHTMTLRSQLLFRCRHMPVDCVAHAGTAFTI